MSPAVPEDSDAAVRRMLSAYAIGPTLRQLRLKKKIALVDLGRQTGLSASMLSQLENGKLIPTLPTLARIAMVFDVGVDHFFGDKKERVVFSIVRAADRIRLKDNPDAAAPAYYFECLAYPVRDKPIQCYVAEFPYRPGSELVEHCHEGAEFLYVLEGRLEIRYHGEVHELQAGDSVYFDGAEPHAYQGLSEPPAKAIVITAGPRP